MKLSAESRKKMREEILKNLEQIPEGQRLHLDKDLLEQLLFLPVVVTERYNEDNGEKTYVWNGEFSEDVVVKIPVWSGEFLRKIDLSEVSFENACFGNYDFYESLLSREEFELLKNEIGIEQLKQEPYIHDFSGTNIVIDFSKVYERSLNYCNFSNVDLLNSNYDNSISLYKCDFSNTGIKVIFDEITNNIDVSFPVQCDFSNNNFSNQTVHYSFFDGVEEDVDCCFKNTGLNIVYDAPSLPIDIMKQILNLCDYYGVIAYNGIDNELLDKFYEVTGRRRLSHYEEHDYKAALEYFLKRDLKLYGYDPNISSYIISFKNALEEGSLDGCYINGKKVLSKEEREQLKNNKIEEYQQYEEEMMSLLSTSLEEQVKHHKR